MDGRKAVAVGARRLRPPEASEFVGEELPAAAQGLPALLGLLNTGAGHAPPEVLDRLAEELNRSIEREHRLVSPKLPPRDAGLAQIANVADHQVRGRVRHILP